ncbi:hypothetical protein EG329_008600 [Mollisiaceae sp. DMI_Dod_QoI]|nr:hypothetical protein EG329_008600 [Helotiales sp. DMI_Dod_QoI]
MALNRNADVKRATEGKEKMPSFSVVPQDSSYAQKHDISDADWEHFAISGSDSGTISDEGSEEENIESETSSSEDDLYNILPSNTNYMSPSAHQTAVDRLPLTTLDTMREVMIDRIMINFWVLYNNLLGPNAIYCTGSSPSSASEMQQESSMNNPVKSPSQLNKRAMKNDEGDDHREDEDDERHLRPRKKTKADMNSVPKFFACPFRKADPKKYNINDYKICALRPWESIAPCQHLYRDHMAPPNCGRCWQVFETTAQLNTHANVPRVDVCEVVEGKSPDGVSIDQAQNLRSKSKRYPNQSGESRWNDIYRILFTESPVPPTPYFEKPREQRSVSPHTRILDDYDSHIREAVPRLFLSEVEEHLTPSAFRNFDLEAVFRTCLERAARSFHERSHIQQTIEPVPQTSGTLQQTEARSQPATPVAERRIRGPDPPGLGFWDAVLQPLPNAVKFSDDGSFFGKCYVVRKRGHLPESFLTLDMPAESFKPMKMGPSFPAPIQLSFLPQQPLREDSSWAPSWIQENVLNDGHFSFTMHTQQDIHRSQPGLNAHNVRENDGPSFIPSSTAFSNQTFLQSSTRADISPLNLSWLDEIDWNTYEEPQIQNGVGDGEQWGDEDYAPFSAMP